MTRSAVLVSICLVAGAALSLPAEETQAPKLRVPEGFVIGPVATEPDVVFPMFAVFDDRGRLFVAESSGLDLYAEISAGTRKCRIRLLEDRDGDGRFETSRVFADQLVFPMGLAWRDGKLYVADPPDLITLEDTDGDGQADKRTIILSGFGHRDNGSLHGLIFGPDGLLYMTMGNPDGYQLKRPDGSVLRGRSGALLRCRPDGSHPEVLCRGFENLVEIVFTPRGEVIGTDNWFQRPSGGMRDALVHLVEGGMYPLHRDVGTPQLITGEPLPAIAMFPAIALSGLSLYRGTAFPADMRGSLFSAQHNARKVERHVLVAEGSTFRAQNFDFVTTDDPDFHPSDVLEAADGSLVVVDTGSWYVHHCPTGQIRKIRAAGGIYRVRPTRPVPVDDPWGLQVDWRREPIERLVVLLDDPRPVVRDRAQETLAAHGQAALAALAAVLGKSIHTNTAKQHAIWALAAIPDETALVSLRSALGDPDPDLVALAARALAVRKDRQAARNLDRLLSADAPHVRLAAAQALAPCGDVQSLPALWQALAAGPDRFLEHALIHALHGLVDAPGLEAALQQPNPRVQKAALLLLDQPPQPRERLTPAAVLGRVAATDPELRQTALQILQNHLEWGEHAANLLREWLKKPTLAEEERSSLPRLLLTFQAQPTVQQLVADTIADRSGQVPSGHRLLVLQTLAQCTLSQLPAAWAEAFAQALQQPVPTVRLEAVRTAAVLQIPQLDEALAQLAESAQEPTELRLEAVRAVVLRQPKLTAASFELLLGQLEDKDHPVARLGAAEILGRSQLTEGQMPRLVQAVRGEALFAPTVLLPAMRRSATTETAPVLLEYLADALRIGWRPSEAELLKVLEALPSELQAKAASVRAIWRQSAEGQRARLVQFEPLLKGGNAEQGKAVFFGMKVACATCHRIGTEGGTVGPDLTKIGAVRSGPDLLEAVVLPSSTIAQGYENYFVATADGRSASGVIARQTPNTLVLRDSSGGELRLRKDQIQELRRQATSLMPEGLERALTADEFRDLLAFLKGLK